MIQRLALASIFFWFERTLSSFPWLARIAFWLARMAFWFFRIALWFAAVASAIDARPELDRDLMVFIEEALAFEIASEPARELARSRRVLAVGRIAERALGAPYIRHPSHGGAARFRETLGACLS